jgi:hypothetical protein
MPLFCCACWVLLLGSDPGEDFFAEVEKADSPAAEYSAHRAGSQISTRFITPITTTSLLSEAYSRSIGGIVIRPCLSGFSSDAPAKRKRV